MADSRVFNINADITVMGIAQAVVGFFEGKKGLISEVVETPAGVIVQAKQKDSWKKFVGMDSSVQVQFIEQGASVVVNVGSGKWIDKAGAATVGALVFAPLLVTAAIGAWANKKLPEEIFDFINDYIITGGKTAMVSMSMSSALKDSEILCPKCKAKNVAGTKFCDSCGEKLIVECPKCGVALSPKTKFCGSCGADVVSELQKAKEQSVIKCTKCAFAIPEGTKFCPECGTAAPVKTENGTVACPQCRAIVKEGIKFCTECGFAIPQKVVPTCKNCGITVAQGVRFCPECGTAV